MTKPLTQAQFAACEDKLSDLIRSSRKDPAAKAAAAQVAAEWEQAIALPQRTAAQRETRLVAIADAAARLGLIAVTAELIAREAAQAPSTLAQACIQLGMTLSEEERAGFRAYADSAPPAGSTLARLRAEEAWEQGDGDVSRVAPESRSGVVADVEALRAQARKP